MAYAGSSEGGGIIIFSLYIGMLGLHWLISMVESLTWQDGPYGQTYVFALFIRADTQVCPYVFAPPFSSGQR